MRQQRENNFRKIWFGLTSWKTYVGNNLKVPIPKKGCRFYNL